MPNSYSAGSNKCTYLNKKKKFSYVKFMQPGRINEALKSLCTVVPVQCNLDHENFPGYQRDPDSPRLLNQINFLILRNIKYKTAIKQ